MSERTCGTDRPSSPPEPRPRRRVPRRPEWPAGRALVLLLGALAAALLLWQPGTAVAENSVVSSSPENGATLDTSPELIVITFAEPLGDANTVSLLCEAESIPLPAAEIGDDDQSLSVEVPQPLPRGTCTITWAVSDDTGAPNGRGNLTFVVNADPATPATTTGDTATTTDATPATTVAPDGGDGEGTDEVEVRDLETVDAGRGPLWLGSFVSILGVAVLLGALFTIASAWPEGVEYLATIRFLRVVWIVALIGTVLYVAAAAAAVTDSGFGSGFSPGAWLDLLDAGWAGRAALLRLVFVLASFWVAWLRPDRVIDPVSQLAALSMPALAVVTIGFSRTVGDFAALGVLLAIAHALAMAIWIGGLVLLARVVLIGPGEEDLVHAVRGFGRLSVMAIVITVVTGVVQMVRLDGGNLFSSGHGRVVLLKSVAVAAMVFVALSARQFVAQRMARANEMTVPLADRLRRAFGIEAGIGVLVLASSSWLVALDPPNIDTTPRIDYAITREVTIPDAGLAATVRLTDDTVGLIGLEVEVVSPESGISGLEVVFTAPPNDQNLGAIVQPIPLTGPGIAVRLESQGLPFAVAGAWTLEMRTTTPAGVVSSDPQVVTILNEDGTTPTTVITSPPTSLVTITTLADDG